MSTAIWPTWPQFELDEIAAATSILASAKVNYWTGEACRHFEHEFASWCGSRHAIALHNGTIALEFALRALGIKVGDEVIVTPRSFVASASSIAVVGATPVFAEVDADSQNITATTIEAVLTPRSKAIIAVHLAGWPCEMPEIVDLAAKHGLKVIEDCAQAHGAAIDGRSVGSFGDINAWSFCQDKIISTGGEGGMLTTCDENLWRQAWEYKDHGKSWEAMHAPSSAPGFRWVHDSIGTNGRMLEVQAAIGRLQLQKLARWQAQRTANAWTWYERLQVWPQLRIPMPPARLTHAWYKFYVFVRPEQFAAGWSRDRLLAEIVAAQVPCFSGSCPEIYREKAFAHLRHPRLAIAAELGENSLMFLIHPTLSTEHVHQMADSVDTVMRKALRS